VGHCQKNAFSLFIEALQQTLSLQENYSTVGIEDKRIDVLLETVVKYIPEGPKLYPDDIVTDQMERFMAAGDYQRKNYGGGPRKKSLIPPPSRSSNGRRGTTVLSLSRQTFILKEMGRRVL